MNRRVKKYADRIRELIKEGEEIDDKTPTDDYDRTIDYAIANTIQIESWHMRVKNISNVTFGGNSLQARRLNEDEGRKIDHIRDIIGALKAALSDLEGGFLIGQEHLIAGEIFDSVLEEAKELLKNGYKDPAAMLARVALEDTLKRLCRVEGLDEELAGKPASRRNDELKRNGRYAQNRWRQIQSWLDIGNAAAHGNFHEYTTDQVGSMIEGVEGFLAQELSQ